MTKEQTAGQSCHYHAGRKARASGAPRELPSYFTKPTRNSRDWLLGWDSLTDKELRELREIAAAVQWAGHFATLAGDCVAGGPAFSHIAEATRAIESRGVPVYHTLATRRLVDASLPFNG